MDSEQNHIDNHLTAKQMQDYLSGNFSNAEMHRIEKHLLECAFCAEAMEGLESMDDYSRFEEDVSALKTRIEKRVQKPKKEKKIVPLYKKVLRIAAMLAVLIVASVLVTNYFKSDVEQKKFSEKKKTELPKEKKTGEKEKEKQVELSSDSTIKPTSVTPPKGDKANIKSNPEKENPEIEKNITQAKSKRQAKSEGHATDEIVTQEAFVFEEAEVIEQEIADIENMEVEEDKMAGITAGEPPVPVGKQKRSMNYTTGEKSNIASIQAFRQITGMVITEDSMPLPFVSIQVKGNNEQTSTNESGKFILMLPEGNQTLIVSSIGYRTEEIEVSGQDTLSIVLPESDIALNEMVVTSAGITKQKKSESGNETRKPRPVNSKKYHQYLKDSLRYPAEATEANIKGTVTLRFNVGVNGEVSQIIVIKSLGYGCDEEAVRLLREGPDWAPGTKNGLPAEMQSELKVKFKL